MIFHIHIYPVQILLILFCTSVPKLCKLLCHVPCTNFVGFDPYFCLRFMYKNLSPYQTELMTEECMADVDMVVLFIVIMFAINPIVACSDGLQVAFLVFNPSTVSRGRFPG